MTPTLLLASVSAQLVSFWKPLIIFATFLPWAWLISSKLDKDARYFHLNRRMFNVAHLSAGVVALAVMLLIPAGPFSFFVGWPLGVLILAAPVLVYWRVRDKDIPEEQKFRLSGIALGDKLAARKQARAARGAVIRFMDAEGEEREVPVKEDPLYPIHLLAEDLIGPAMEARATHLDILLSPKGAAVGQIVDGIRYKRDPIPTETALKLIDYIKGIASLNIEDRRRRQIGTFRLYGPTGDVMVHVTTAGSSSGHEMRIEFNRANRLLRPFDSLGLLAPQAKAMHDLEETHERHGIILIAAPPGQGLSTSTYSFVGRHDAYTSNIKTLESDVLVRIDGVDHVQWDPSNPAVDYATNLQSILRRDPDVVLAGRVRDTQTAQIAADPGLQGPLIYIPIRATSIGSAIREWVKLVGTLKRAVAPLRAVTNQRLLRTLCPNCKQAYQPSADRLARLNLPASVKQLHQASGKVQIKNKIEQCPVCAGTGYLGQTGIFEVMVVTDDVRRALLGGDLKAALAAARRNKMVYLQEAALSKIVAGDTTIDEVIRVTAPPKNTSATEPKQSASPAPVQPKAQT
jgi:type II secretory ATPase GspE/PulE/Tfp pilus assembly ATPase PilB-like protein